MNNFKVLMNGIVKENPTFVLLLGMCPTLGTTSSAINGMGMGPVSYTHLCYLILGAYTEKLRKRADLKNGEICKKVHIGHSTFNDLKKGQNAH